MSARPVITSMFEQVAREQKKTLSPLVDDLVLIDCGLDSLCYAIITARLEDDLGIDPFSAAGDVEFPMTFGDFVRFYDAAAK